MNFSKKEPEIVIPAYLSYSFDKNIIYMNEGIIHCEMHEPESSWICFNCIKRRIIVELT